MRKTKRIRLARAGWRTGSVRDFLGLTSEEDEFIEMKIALSDDVKRRRVEQGMTQAEMAELIGSSQSRVAKMESADVSVSLDLLVRTILALGASRKEVARIIGSRVT